MLGTSPPTTDQRLLEPGWGGDLAPDELDFLQTELTKDKKLAYQWGFQPAKKRRPEWAIHQIATFGDPDIRATNMGLARRRTPPNLESKDDFQAQTLEDKISGHLEKEEGMGAEGVAAVTPESRRPAHLTPSMA